MTRPGQRPGFAKVVASFMAAMVVALGGMGWALSLFADQSPVFGVCVGAVTLAVLAWIYPPDEKEY